MKVGTSCWTTEGDEITLAERIFVGRNSMWILLFVLLLLGAQLNLTALVPLQAGDPSPPWWVGGRLLWPFAVETRTLLPTGGALGSLTPILGIASATLFLLSIVLQVIWFSGWAVPPLFVDIALLWAVFGQHITVESLRG
jgi:hypothetical protein